MSVISAYLLLLLAAILEAGGDALVRVGLHQPNIATRAALFTCGGLVLFAYGLAVNAPPWDFGRLLGVYVTLFFVVAQVINLVFFRCSPRSADPWWRRAYHRGWSDYHLLAALRPGPTKASGSQCS